MRNKILTLFLVTCLILPSTVSFSAITSKIDTTNEIASAMFDMKLIAGDQRGLRLNDTLTRAESLVLITRILGKQNQLQQNNNITLPFSDVKRNDWCTPYIQFAYVHKIAVGISATKFMPNAPVSEKEFKTMLLSALNYETPNDFTWDNLENLSYSLGFTELTASKLNRSGALTLTFETLLQKPKNKNMIVLEQLLLDKQIDINSLKSPHVKNLLHPNLIAGISNSMTAKQSSSAVNKNLPNAAALSQNDNSSIWVTTSVTNPAVTQPTSPTVPSIVQPTQNKTTINLNYTSEWVEPNAFTFYFEEVLDRYSIEQHNAVKVYMVEDNETIEMPIRHIVYNPDENRLTIQINGGADTRVCKIVFNEQLIKTQTGNPVKFRSTPNLLVAKSTFSANTIASNFITLKCKPDFDPNSLGKVTDGKVVFERLKKTFPIIKTEYNNDSHTLKLHTDIMPELSYGKVIMPSFTTDSGSTTYDGYTIPIRTPSFNYPQVELVESNTTNLIHVHYSMNMDYATVSRMSNYELYNTTVALQNRVGIEQVEVVDPHEGSRHVLLRINNMVEGQTYKLKIRHMRAAYGNELQETDAFTFKAMSAPSSAKLASVQSTMDNKLTFAFSGAMDTASVLKKENYTITCKGNKDTLLDIQTIKYNASTQTYEMSFINGSLLNNDSLMIQFDARNLKDDSGKTLLQSNSRFFCMNWDRKITPNFEKVIITSPSGIQLSASTDLNANAAQNEGNYRMADIDGNAVSTSVIKAVYNPDSRIVLLELNNMLTFGKAYKITISNMLTPSGVGTVKPIELLFTASK